MGSGTAQGRVLNEAMPRDGEMVPGSRADLGRWIIGAVGGLTDWVTSTLSDVIADDSDKSFAVPAATEQQVLWIWVEYLTDATAGNRQLVVEIQDAAADVIGRWKAGIVQAVSQTTYTYCFAPSNADLTALRDSDYIMTPLPPTLILPAGYIIRVYDNKAISAAADDMVVKIHVARRTV